MVDLTEEQQQERDKLIIECMALGYAVNRYTEYCTFVDFSGHVDSISIRICPNKNRFNDEIATSEFNIKGKYQNESGFLMEPNKWLQMKRDMLREILETKSVPTEHMEYEVEHIRRHYF